jgi:hypothetical protein
MKTRKRAAHDYSTHRKRRAAVFHMVGQLEYIADAEEAYRDNIPIELLGTEIFDDTDYCICRLDEAADILRSIYASVYAERSVFSCRK